MRKIYFINRYYSPDHSATSQLLTDLAEYLAREKFDVHVVACRQLYEDPKESLESTELLNDVLVHRVFSTAFGRRNLFGRVIDYATFYIYSFIFLIVNVKQDDIVVAKTDPPLISVIAAIVVKAKKAKLVNWIQDLFPEVVEALSPNAIPKPFYTMMKNIRNWSLKEAEKNIVIGEGMRMKLLENNVGATRIISIPNWYVGPNVKPWERELEQLKSEWGLEDKYVVGYSGNLGRAHEYEIFASVAEEFRDDEDVIFLFIGAGASMNKLKEIVLAKNIENIVFKPYQPLSRLTLSLQVADVHLVSLIPNLEGLIVPSKFYGILAASRPVIFIGAYEGELAKVIEKYNIGSNVLSGDKDGLVEKINIFKSGEANIHHKDLRKIFDENFSSNSSLEKWCKVLN